MKKKGKEEQKDEGDANLYRRRLIIVILIDIVFETCKLGLISHVDQPCYYPIDEGSD
jgi:hypothetical protein